MHLITFNVANDPKVCYLICDRYHEYSMKVRDAGKFYAHSWIPLKEPITNKEAEIIMAKVIYEPSPVLLPEGFKEIPFKESPIAREPLRPEVEAIFAQEPKLCSYCGKTHYQIACDEMVSSLTKLIENGNTCSNS